MHGQEGVYELAQKGGEIAEVFGEFCRDSLCMESWDFIIDCMAYKVCTVACHQTDYATRALSTNVPASC